MTEFEKIITAIEPFGLPYAPDIYEGSEERFFVYNYADERAVFYADNAPAAVRASVQVHLYIPAEENFIVLKNRVRRALYQQGFTYPEVTVLREVKKRHIIFECDIEEEMEEKVMAYVGLAKPTVAKLDESSGTPKYTDGFTCGKAMALDISPQYAEGSLFADNKKSEYDKEFKYADVTLGTDTLPIQAHTVMFGHTVAKEGESGTSIKNRTTDSSNYVGLGIYMDEKVDGLKKYVAMWIYKVKFAEGQESFKTKGDNIEYQTPSIAGQAIGIDDNLWKETMIYDTEKEARDWIDEMAGIKKDQTQEGGGESGSGEPVGGEQGGEGSGGGTTSGEETGEKENGGETV